MSTEFRDQVAHAMAVQHADALNAAFAKTTAHLRAQGHAPEELPPFTPDDELWRENADAVLPVFAAELRRLAGLFREPPPDLHAPTCRALAEELDGRAAYLAPVD